MRVFEFAVIGLLLTLALAWYYDDPLRTTPGFFVDESSIAYNAWSISRSAADEHGITMPLYFRAFGEYKNPVYIYLLAAIFKITGPGILVARTLSILLGFCAAIALAMLVRTSTGNTAAAAFTFLAVLMTPWLFETSRLVFEVAAFPLAVALALIAIRRGGFIAIALALAAVTYTYSAGRLVGPAMALGLLLFLPQRRIAEILRIWAAYAVTLIPLVVFAIRNPGAITARLNDPSVAGGNVFTNWLAAFSPRFLFLEGDPNARHHVAAGGELLISVAILAAIGIVMTIRRAKTDGWSRYLLWLLFIAPLPGAITRDPHHALRLITLGVMLIVFAGIGMRRNPVFATIFFVALIGEGLAFRNHYEVLGPLRQTEFDATYPLVLDEALAAQKPPIGVSYPPGDAYYIHAWWYGALRGIDRTQLPRYEPGTEPRGSVIIGNGPQGFIAVRK